MTNFLRNLPNLSNLKDDLQNHLHQAPNLVKKNIQFEKAKAKLIVSQAKSNLNFKSELLEKETRKTRIGTTKVCICREQTSVSAISRTV